MWQYEPLRYPAGWLDPPKPSTFERVCRRIPVLGWIVASFCHAARWKPIQREFLHQFTARQPVPPDAWGENSQRRAVAACMTKRIGQWIGWPQDCLAPDDPLEVLFWDPMDYLTASLALSDVVDDLRIEVTEEERNALWKLKTFGQAVDFLVEKGGGKPGEARRT